MLMDTDGHTILSEDYVSFEVAKLLKEKGFDGLCSTVYETRTSKHNIEAIAISNCGKLNQIKRPTIQMAMKWLREKHNIFIEISVDEMLKDEGYQWALYYNSTKEIRPYSGWGGSYEKACEAAIGYCLENLI